MIKPQGFYRGLRFVRAQNHLCPWVARARAKKWTKSRGIIVQKNRQKSTGITLTFTHKGVKMIKPQGFYRGLRFVSASLPQLVLLWPPVVSVACCGLLWLLVASCGLLWPLVASSGLLWAAVVSCGLLWPPVACCGPLLASCGPLLATSGSK